MATYNTQAVFSADIRDFQKKINQALDNLKNMNSELSKLGTITIQPSVSIDGKKADKELGEIDTKLGKLNKKKASMTADADVSPAEKKLGELESKAEKVSKDGVTISADASTAQAEASIGKLKSKMENLSGKSVTLDADATPATEKIGSLKGKLDDFIHTAGTKPVIDVDTSGASSKISSLTSSMAGMALKIGGGIGLISAVSNGVGNAFDRIDTMEGFERTMGILGKTTDETSTALSTLKDSVTGTAYGLDTAAKATQNLVTRGMGLSDATDEVEIWFDAVSTYAGGSEDAFDSVMDAVAKMRTKGKVEMDQLNRLYDAGINPVSDYAKAVGKSEAQVSKALSNGEISAEDFLDTVEDAWKTGVNGATKIAGAAKTAGKTWAGSFANMRAACTRGMSAIITTIDDALESSGLLSMRDMVLKVGTGFEDIAKKVAEVGSVAIPAIFTFVKDSGLGDVVSKIYNGFVDLGNAVSDLVTQQVPEILSWLKDNDTLHTSVELIGSAIDTVFSAATDLVSVGVPAVLQFFADHPTLSTTIEAVAIGFGSIELAIKGIEGALAIGGAIAAVGGALASFGETIALVGMEFVSGGIVAGLESIAGLIPALASNPIGWMVIGVAIIAALVAGVVILFNKCEGFRNWVLDTFENIKTAASEFISGFGLFGEALGQGWEDIKTGASNAFENMKQNADNFTTACGNVATNVGNFFSNCWTTTSQEFSQTMSAIGTAAQEKFDHIAQIGSDIWTNISTAAENFTVAWQTVCDSVKQIWDTMWENVGNIDLKEIGKNAIEGLKQGAEQAWESFKTWWNEMIAWMPGWAKSFLEIKSPSRVMGRIGNDTMAGLANGISDGDALVQDAFKSSITTLADTDVALSDVSFGAVDIPVGTVASGTDELISSFESIQSPVTKSLTNVTNTAQAQTSKMSQVTIANAVQMDSGFETQLSTMGTNSVNLMSSMVSQIKSTVSTLPSFFSSIGSQMMSELASGIRSSMSTATSAAASVVSTLVSTFKTGLGIASPSKVMTWIGQMMLAGLIKGMSKEEIIRFTAKYVDDMKSSFGSGDIKIGTMIETLGTDGAQSLISYLAKNGDSDTLESVVTNTTTTAFPLPGSLTDYIISSYFGYRSASDTNGIGSTYHQGIDISGSGISGTPIYAMANGTVTIAGGYGGYGNAVEIDHGGGNSTLYGHMSAVATTAGASVKAGDLIGYVGSTGNSTGPHLHFSYISNGTMVDPLPYLQGAQMTGTSTTSLTLGKAIQNALTLLGNGKSYSDIDAMGSNVMAKVTTKNESQAREALTTALKVTGMYSAENLEKQMALAYGESGYDSDIVNTWDSNWVAGHPSIGLMQVIQPTFDAYKMSGYDDIYDAVSNAIASINYQMAVYGHLLNSPGYSVGSSYIPQDMLAMLHKGEVVLPVSDVERLQRLANPSNPYSNSNGNILDTVLNLPGSGSHEGGMTHTTQTRGNQDIYLTVVSQLDGREVGRGTAKYVQQENDWVEARTNRMRGVK